ncbi:type 1 glutamine amidotransferase domain-containing protein [Coprothermobacter platensis]|uniref:type 1 glutamine amidotransferase domain-containing protein n=1 Tax=Coprothermobacter platensis TaxID=108819 RepID=UPI0003671C16|nr:type 1 glutamine amidotransferase domain-containing protein [Coprothermobacter platensis]
MAGKVAILLDEGFEDLEFFYPYLRMQEENFQPVVLGIEPALVKGKNGLSFQIEESLKNHVSDEFAGLYIPGGHAPDKLRRYDVVKEFVAAFFKQNKPIGTICHGPQVLISAKVVNGLLITSVSAIKDDLENAGAKWVDKPVVVDKNIVSSRIPDDLPYNVPAFLSLLSK